MARREQFDLISFLTRFNTDEACREYLVNTRWKGRPICPHCKCKKVYEYSTRPVYKCVECAKQFRVTTGTIFEDSKIPLTKWFLAINLMVCYAKGISSIELGKVLGITQKSAWYMEQNIRRMMGNKKSKMLDGIVEVDETYVGGKRRGSKRGRGAEHKTPVFGILKRQGDLWIIPVENCKKVTLERLIREHVKERSKIMSDEFKSYNGLHEFYNHQFVNHGAKEYVNGEIHTNSLEGAWSLMKRIFKGIYHRPSRKHMEAYTDEFEFRYNNRKKTMPDKFKTAVKQSGTRMKHADIIK